MALLRHSLSPVGRARRGSTAGGGSVCGHQPSPADLAAVARNLGTGRTP